MSALEVNGLTKHFAAGGARLFAGKAKLHAVDDVSFTLRPGTITALVGESGSGKSTVARILARLYEPTAGTVVFEGLDATRSARRKAILRYRSQVQMIFQDPFGSLNPVKTIAHHLERPLRIHRIVPARRASRSACTSCSRRVGLVPAKAIAPKYPHELSGGQRQRVAIARALAVEPRVILADEPTSMLDVSIRIGILNLMLKLKEDRDLAFLYVTHDLASARYVADEMLVMYAGQIVERGPTEEVLQNPLHPYTRLLLSAVPDPRPGLRLDGLSGPPLAPRRRRPGRRLPLRRALPARDRPSARSGRRSSSRPARPAGPLSRHRSRTGGAPCLSFPAEFVWGAATAAYQIEGAAGEDGRGESIWDRFCATPGKVRNGDSGAVACDFYHRFPDDIALMRELGLDSFRFSVAWPRVLPGRPRPGQRGRARLLRPARRRAARERHRAVRHALPLGPAAAARGRRRLAEPRHRRGVRRVRGGGRPDGSGDRVTRWITHNEPWVASWLGYGWGILAPGRTSERTRSRPRTTCCSRTAGRSRCCAARRRPRRSGSRSTSRTPSRRARPRPTSTPPGRSTGR